MSVAWQNEWLALTERKEMEHSVATALASSVLPVPAGLHWVMSMTGSALGFSTMLTKAVAAAAKPAA